MNKFSGWSDFEVNKAVACLSLDKGYFSIDMIRNEVMYFHNGGGKGVYRVYDPCNNPTDAFSVIAKNNISLHAPRLKECWMADFAGSDEDVNDGFQIDYYTAHNQNLLRAAMEVFLLIHDARKG